MKWDGRRVLVTGAGGFIGSHLAERLTELGARTRALVRYTSTGTHGWLDSSPRAADIEVVRGDIRDQACVHQATGGVEVIFHLAALIGIPYSYEAPISYVRTNIEGTLNVLEEARAREVLVVQTSTSEVYGSAREVPIPESHPLQAQSPYAATKIGADKLAESYWDAFDARVVIVRPFNTYGPRQSARAVIPTIISQALTSSEVHLGNVETTRDFNYVTDTVEGFVEAAAHPDAVGRTINLGSGREITIRELATSIFRLMNVTPNVVVDEQRTRPVKSEVERLWADATLAHELLGWAPRYTLEAGLEHTIRWIRDNASQYRTHAYAR